MFQKGGKTYPFLFQKGGKSGSILFQKGGKKEFDHHKTSLNYISEFISESIFFLFPTFIKASPITIQTISRTRVINAA